jgi:hypothetical protein
VLTMKTSVQAANVADRRRNGREAVFHICHGGATVTVARKPCSSTPCGLPELSEPTCAVAQEPLGKRRRCWVCITGNDVCVT